MDEISPIVNGTSIQLYDPFDVLYQANPEIATLAYAHKAKILTPELLPYVAHFRSLQSDEKIALLGAMVDKLGIESNERIALMGEITARYSVDSDERKHNRSEEGLNYRTRVQAATLDGICDKEQAGQTEREIIKANGARDLQQLKYAAKFAIVQAQESGKRYISDNELAATQIEVEALAGAIKYSAQARKDAELGVAQIELETRVREAEIVYASGIAQAEKMRDIASINQRGGITMAYIEAQAGILRNAAMAKTQVDSESYRTLQVFAQEGARVLQGRGETYVRVSGATSHGPVNLEISIGREE